jgi:hypothetical protein
MNKHRDKKRGPVRARQLPRTPQREKAATPEATAKSKNSPTKGGNLMIPQEQQECTRCGAYV